MKTNILIFFSLLFCLHGKAQCSRFNDPFAVTCDNWDLRTVQSDQSTTAWFPIPAWLVGGPSGSWVHPGYPLLNPLDGTPYVVISDDPGFPSAYYNATNYRNLGSTYLGYDLTFDYAAFEDAETLPPTGPTPIHPRIYVTDGTHTIYFEAYATVDDVADNFVSVKAPIALAVGGILPSNAEGQWYVAPGTSVSDFNPVMLHNTEIYFDLDFLIPNTPVEVIGVDNVCVKANCDNTNTDYAMDIHFNTDPLTSPSLLPNNYVQISLNSFNPAYRYQFTWGDGAVTTGHLPFASHVYAAAGTYTFKLARIDTFGNAICNSTSTVFCIPAGSQYQTTTGGMTPPVAPVCNVGFDLNYHYNTSPSFTAFPPSNRVTIAINVPHSGSIYTYDWGGSTTPVTTPATSQSYVYGWMAPSSLQICVEEMNGNDDGFCRAKTCADLCGPVSYTSLESARYTAETEVVMNRKETAVNVYPNPATQHVTVELETNGDEDVSVCLLDMAGRSLYTAPPVRYSPGKQKIPLDLQGIPTGIYQLKVNIGSVSTYKKLIVTQ